jgi:hypothetical protein
MHGDLSHRVLSLLARAPTPSLPLSRLHGALVAEAGDGVGTYAQLRSELARRSDLFVILESHDPLGFAAWPGDARGEYEQALLGACGAPGTRVALAATPPPPPAPFEDPATPALALHALAATPAPLHQLDASLIHLWAVSGDDPVLRADLAEAMTRTGRSGTCCPARTATPPRGWG